MGTEEMTQFSCSIPLPPTFRPGDILAFHRRDRQEIAERVEDASLHMGMIHKGMIWHGFPAYLSVRFEPGVATAALVIDGEAPEDSHPVFERMVRRMLGLTQGIELFEEQYRGHPQLGPMIARQPGLRIPATATPFEALAWAITGQQISVGVAVSLRRKLIGAVNIRHSSGLFCHPDAHQICRLNEETLRQAGFSTTKARTLLTLSALVASGELPLDAWVEGMETLPVDLMRERLEAIRGIGPWTVNYSLLRGFGWLDGSLHGDVAVRRGLQTLLQAPDKMREEEVKHWLAQFSPWRALVGAHLWASLASTAY